MKQASDSFDLPRLTETDPSLGEELALLKAQLPDASELALMASRLQLQGIDVTPKVPAPSGMASPWSKWLLVGGGAVAVGFAWWALVEAQPAVPDERGTPVSRTQVAVPSVPAPNSAQVALRAPRRETAIARPGPLDSPAPLVEGLAAPAATPSSDASALEPAQPSAVRTSEPSRAVAQKAGGLSPTSEGHGGSSSSAVSPESASRSTEIELLREARLALKRSPATALELTEQHTRAYPSGKLVQERELIAVSALMAQGRRTAALSRAARFERAFPQSPYRKQLAELLH